MNVKLAQNVRVGAWILIGLNLMMALGSIWVFIRMAPAIERIIDRNERSLQAGEEMLASLAMAGGKDADNGSRLKSFADALTRARGNITENEEPLALDSITMNYPGAFRGDGDAGGRTIAYIVRLGDINRAAMVNADRRARQVGNAGAWGVVFMASSLFLVGMLFLRGLKRNLIQPFEEVHSVVTAFRNGDTMRRCTGTNLPKDFATVFRDVNELLDRLEA
ncbi:MAG: hypothetical protein JW913_03120 [Chitinispirillaceae bacterium]|nr:hypothetical protein [Chitinispirillaceae bacterium]